MNWLERGIFEQTESKRKALLDYLCSQVDGGSKHIKAYVNEKLKMLSAPVLPFVDLYAKSIKQRIGHGLRTAVKTGSLEQVVDENYKGYVERGSSEKHINEQHEKYKEYDSLRKEEFRNIVKFFREMIDTGEDSFMDMFDSAYHGKESSNLMLFLDASKKRTELLMKNPSMINIRLARVISGFAVDLESRALNYVAEKVNYLLKAKD